MSETPDLDPQEAIEQNPDPSTDTAEDVPNDDAGAETEHVEGAEPAADEESD